MIAPKTRNTAASIAKEKHVLSEPSSRPATSSSLSPAVQQAKRQLLRILPENVTLPGLRNGSTEPDRMSALVSPSHFNLLARAFPSTRVSVSIKACPGASPAGHVGEDQDAKGKGKGRESLVDGDQPGAVGEPAQAINLHLKASSAIPPGCIWLSHHARQALGSLDSYDLLRLGDVKPGETSQSDSAVYNLPNVSEAHIDRTTPAGMQRHLDKALSHIRQSLASRAGLSLVQSSCQTTTGLLMTGASGAGKTSLIHAISAEAQTDARILSHIQYISCTPLVNQRVPQLQAKFAEVFKLAAWHAPSIVVFDDLDRLMPAEMEHVDSFRSQHIASLFFDVASKAMRDRPIVVVATCKGQEALHATLSQSHFFGAKVSLLAPDKDARKQIFQSILEKKLAGSTEMPITSKLDYTTVSTQTDGYLPVDLKDLVDRCIQQCAMRTTKEGARDLVLTVDDVNAAQADFTPLSLRDVKLQKSEVQWSDIGGLQDTRRVLRETLEWPTKYGAIFASSPLRLRSG